MKHYRLKERMMRSRRVMTVVCLLAAALCHADEPPRYSTLPKHQTPVPYAGKRNWHVTQNLGATGARGWVHGHSGASSSRDSREIIIKSIEAGSPADGILQPYDIVVGAVAPPAQFVPGRRLSLKRFTSDARLAFARALTYAESEAGKGELKLLRWRDGKTEAITVTIPVMGTYSKTAPFDCPKTKKVVENAGGFLANNMPVDGFATMEGSINALFLLGTGDDRYLDHVRRSACSIVRKQNGFSNKSTWSGGYNHLFLCEYYLATGDERVLPAIKVFSDGLAEGMGKPGTWGHGMARNHVTNGYGAMNQAGLIALMSLVMAERCGIAVDRNMVQHGIDFFGSYAGIGSLPYGDHPPALKDATGNGKNGSAAIVFSLLGCEPAAQWFARLCCCTGLFDFEQGHTGNYFNQIWTPLAASLTGRRNYIAFWSRFNSYRDLARRWDGSFIVQPWPHDREGDLGMGNYVSKGPMWATGGFALSYLAQNNELAILGRERSVFGNDVPSVLKPALQLYQQKKFAHCQTTIKPLLSSGNVDVKGLARQLYTIAGRNLNSIELTVADMQKRLKDGDVVSLKWQLDALESVVDADDPRLTAFRRAVAQPMSEAMAWATRVYHEGSRGPRYCGLPGCSQFLLPAQVSPGHVGGMSGISRENKFGAYSKLAQDLISKYPPNRSAAIHASRPDVPLCPPPAAQKRRGKYFVPDTKAQSWKMNTTAGTGQTGWQRLNFDDRDWQKTALPCSQQGKDKSVIVRHTFHMTDPSTIEELTLTYVLQGTMQVYLNGTRVMDIAGNSNYKHVILLKPLTRELVKKGENVLAVKATGTEKGLVLDCILQALLQENR